MKKFNKKGMEGINGLYSLVLVIALIGIIAAVALVVLGNLATSTGVTPDAQAAINSTIDAIATIPSTWMGLIVTIAVLVVIVVLLIKGFSSFGGGTR
jgi:hypothetical protein